MNERRRRWRSPERSARTILDCLASRMNRARDDALSVSRAGAGAASKAEERRRISGERPWRRETFPRFHVDYMFMGDERGRHAGAFGCKRG